MMSREEADRRGIEGFVGIMVGAALSIALFWLPLLVLVWLLSG